MEREERIGKGKEWLFFLYCLFSVKKECYFRGNTCKKLSSNGYSHRQGQNSEDAKTLATFVGCTVAGMLQPGLELVSGEVWKTKKQNPKLKPSNTIRL